MSIDNVTICSWKKKDYTAENLLEVINKPKFYCQHCGRVANKKKYLCEPERLVPKS